MIVDGIGTAIASFFGSPFGTVVYIGHPAYKRSGALVGYSLANGMVYLILSWFGILALVQSIVNRATIGPIVLFVGLMVNEEALNFMPARHYSAYVIGLFPSIYDWVVNVSNMSPLEDFDTGGNSNLTGLPQWFGVLAWKRGALLVSFVWVAMLVMVIDRRWKSAGIWALVAAVFACCGIIHVPEAGFESFSQPTWEQCEAYPDNCWPFAEQWMFFVSYLMLFGTFALIELSRKYECDPSLLPPLFDETAHAFDDWFADAAIVVHMHTHAPNEEIDEPIIDKSTQMKPDHHVKVVDDDPDSTHQTGKESVSNAKEDSTSSEEANLVIVPPDEEEFGA